jgi:hypothetical protein
LMELYLINYTHINCKNVVWCHTHNCKIIYVSLSGTRWSTHQCWWPVWRYCKSCPDPRWSLPRRVEVFGLATP